MTTAAALPSAPKGSSVESLIAAVARVYARVESEQATFLASAAASGSALECPSGCGSCCAPFVPDVLPPEAAYIAAWLMESSPDLALEAALWTGEKRPATPPCPFLRHPASGSPGGARCAIYPARPLVCRLFGAAGVRDRDGLASFRPCAHMPLSDYPAIGGARPAIAGPSLELRFGAAPPVMADFSAELAALCPSEAAERSLLVDALPGALARVGLSIALAEDSTDRSYSGRNEHEEEARADLAGSVAAR